MTETEQPLFNACICDGVVTGHCVMLADDEMSVGEVIYAGPIKTAPSTGGKLVLLNSIDFARLKTAIERQRH